MNPALLLLAVSIHANFEGGNVGKVEAVTPRHFRCAAPGESDQDRRNRQANWYYFRVDGAAGQDMTVDLVNLPGEYNYKPNRGAVTKDTIPVYSVDGRNWRHFDPADVSYDEREPLLRLRFHPPGPHFWIAHVPPYTNRDLRALLAGLRSNPFLRVQTLGKTPRGRAHLLLTITDPSTPPDQKRVVWLMFRQHSWETGSSWSGEGAIRFLSSPSESAGRIRRETIFKILPLCDPDGVARGGVRFNAQGFDLNRNWDLDDPRRMPEIAVQRKAILDWVDSGHRIDLFVSLHNTETGEYLEGPPAKDGRFHALMRRFCTALTQESRFAPTREVFAAEDTATPGKSGRMTVIQGLYRDRAIPGFLIEQMISRNPKLGRMPTAEDRQDFGAGLVRAAWLALQ